jgi:tyrosyl-tRNA synthetase
MGGTDQTFNILMGRNLQKDYGEESQIALFMPILEGTDGLEKMSKSLGNYIGINEAAEVIFQKTMTIPDNLIIKYFELATDIHPDEVYKLKVKLEDPNTNPRDIKMHLARELTKLYCGEKEASSAEDYFRTVFQKNLIPDKVDEFNLSKECFNDIGEIDIVKVITMGNLTKSASEARRLIAQNGVKIEGKKINVFSIINPNKDFVIQVGKSKFIKVKV